MAVLKRGSKGSAVKDVQKKLNNNKAKPKLEVDGVFGEGTDKAVRTFQKGKGLKVDGMVGPNTLAALDGKASGKTADKNTGSAKDPTGGAGSDSGGSGGGKKTRPEKPPKWEHPDYVKLLKNEGARYEAMNRDIAKADKSGAAGLDSSDRKSFDDLVKDWKSTFPEWHKLVRTLSRDHRSFQKLEKSDPAKARELIKAADKLVPRERQSFKEIEAMGKSWTELERGMVKAR